MKGIWYVWVRAHTLLHWTAVAGQLPVIINYSIYEGHRSIEGHWSYISQDSGVVLNYVSVKNMRD